MTKKWIYKHLEDHRKRVDTKDPRDFIDAYLAQAERIKEAGVADTSIDGECVFLVETPQGCHICFIITNKYKTQKGEKLQTPEILDKYSSSALLN